MSLVSIIRRMNDHYERHHHSQTTVTDVAIAIVTSAVIVGSVMLVIRIIR